MGADVLATLQHSDPIRSLIERHRRCLVVVLEPVASIRRDDSTRLLPSIEQAEREATALIALLTELDIPHYIVPASLPLERRVPFIETLLAEITTLT